MRRFSPFSSLLACGVLLLGLCSRAVGQAEPVVYPEDSGWVDVTKPPYGAKGDGVTDDTEAIRAAIRENRRVYLPKGTYLVTGVISMRDAKAARAHCSLFGAGPDHTVIKLPDNAPGFAQPNKEDPFGRWKASGVVIRTNSDPGPPDAAIGNFLGDFTVDTGKGNPGAVGIDFLGNNRASIRNVRIVSGDGQGQAGISVCRIPGPALLKGVSIEGFDYGVRFMDDPYNMVMEDVTLKGQRVAGIFTDANLFSARRIRSENRVPAVVIASRTRKEGGDPVRSAIGVVVDSEFTGGDPAQPAIACDAYGYFANIRTSGYRAALSIQGKDNGGPNIDETVVGETLSLFPNASSGSLRLPVKETPVPVHPRSDQWTSPFDFLEKIVLRDGAPLPERKPDAKWPPRNPAELAAALGLEIKSFDMAGAIQAAMDSGKPVVYFPKGTYLTSRTLRVPPTVKRLHGFVSVIEPLDAAGGDFRLPDVRAPLFLFAADTPEPVVLEYFISDFRGNGPYLRKGCAAIVITGKRPVVISDSEFPLVMSKGEAGPVFVEDCANLETVIDGPTDWFVRQLNPEGYHPRVTNNGGRFWCLGFKTEGPDTMVRTVGGGQSEILGAYLRPSAGFPMSAPAWDVDNGSLAVISTTYAHRPDRAFYYHVREKRGSETKTITRAELIERGLMLRGDGFLPLFVANPSPEYKPAPVVLEAKSGAVPAPWKAADIGAPDLASDFQMFRGGFVHLTGAGYARKGVERRGIGTREETGAFLAAPFNSKASLAARLVTVSQSLNPRLLTAGLTLRAGIEADDPSVFFGLVEVTPKGKPSSNLVLLQRDGKSEPVVLATLPTGEAPWLKLDAAEGTVTALLSEDGKTWKPVGTAKLDWLADKAWIGMAIGSTAPEKPATVRFADWRLDLDGTLHDPSQSSALSPAWTTADLCADREGYRPLREGKAVMLPDGGVRLTGSGWFYNNGRRYFCRSAYRVIPSGQQITARVTLESLKPSTARAGIRFLGEPGEAPGKMVSLSVTPTSVDFDHSLRFGDESSKFITLPLGAGGLPAPGQPIWLRLAYEGTDFRAFASADGESWREVGVLKFERTKDAIPWPYLDVFVTSGDLDHDATASFQNLSIEPATPPSPSASPSPQ